MGERRFRWIRPGVFGLFEGNVLVVECHRAGEGGNRSLYTVIGPFPDRCIQDPAALPDSVKKFVVYGRQNAEDLMNRLAYRWEGLP